MIGNGQEVKAQCMGTVKLVGMSGNIICLHKVLYIPEFTTNIMSLSKLMERGTGIKGDKMKLTLLNRLAKMP